jgi:hypothetical protein
MEQLPNDLLTVIDEYLLPSKVQTQALFAQVVSDIEMIVDPTVSIAENLRFIKAGLYPPVLRRQKGFYSLHHYLH